MLTSRQQIFHSRRHSAVVLAWLLGALFPANLAARDLYVAPAGLPSNDGSIARPLDLTTAISSGTPARPGDTIWMRGGVYAGPFVSALTGTVAQPITLRQYPGERATVDGAASPASATFVVLGAYATYCGFEITNTGGDRTGGDTSRGTGLDIYGSHTRFINLVVHDAQTGVGLWTPAVDAELYGLVIYNNGVEGPDRGHGHSIYTQNDTGTKRIVDNIAFNSFSFGIHAYTQGGQINNFLIQGNVLFDHGNLSAISGPKANMLLGGSQVSENAAILNNFTYYAAGYGGRSGDIGYITPCDAAIVQGNLWIGDTAINLNCSNTTFTGNTLYGAVAASTKAAYPSNAYLTTRPAGTQVFVRPNQYEPGRANIVVYNWARQPQVSVDLSSAGLAIGDEFEIRDAQDFFGAPVVTGVYSGAPVPLWMSGLSAAAVIGNAPIQPQHTDQEFGAFVLLRRSSSSSTSPSATLTASPQAITAGQSSTLSWSTRDAATVVIAPAIGAVGPSGSLAVNPGTTTMYTLTASAASGATTSANATVTVSAPVTPPSPGGTAAAFVRTDLTTQGSWRGVYGSEGYAIANDSTSLPAGVRVTFGQQLAWTWSPSTTIVRALQKGGTSTGRLAACWYSTGTFNIDITVTDGAVHEMAIYSLDWDSQARVQTIEVDDAVSGAVLDRQTVSGFAGGQYLVWRVSGHVVVRVTRTGPNSSAVSGLFFAPTAPAAPPPPPPANVPPTVGLTSPGAGATFVAPATIPLTASAADSDGTVAAVRFAAGGNPIGTGVASGSSYTYTWANVPAGTYHVTATATDNSGATAVSAAVDISVVAPAPPPPPPPTTPPPTSPGAATAVFVQADSTTQGSWQGAYGAEGYSLANDSARYPSYAQVTLVNQQAWTWAASTPALQALQKGSSTDRVAACWYTGTAFNLDVNLTDGAVHQVAVYALDWDNVGRGETIDVLDATTGALLDSRAVAGFAQGQYRAWRLSGHVTIRITRTGGNSATISGIFFDAAVPGQPAPIVPPPVVPPVIVPGPGGAIGTAATFVRTDTTTVGSWKGHYGADGYGIANDSAAYPSYVQVALSGQSTWTWAASASDPRALQRGGSAADRIAACWYSASTFNIDLTVTDGAVHQVALYGLDWDGVGRGQTYEVRDALTGALLDTQTLAGFQGGRYTVWQISGHVTIRVTRTAGNSAVLSGLFFAPAP